jgi:hypothetical protein
MFFELCKVMICHAMVNEVNQRMFLLVFLHYNVCASIFSAQGKMYLQVPVITNLPLYYTLAVISVSEIKYSSRKQLG